MHLTAHTDYALRVLMYTALIAPEQRRSTRLPTAMVCHLKFTPIERTERTAAH